MATEQREVIFRINVDAKESTAALKELNATMQKSTADRKATKKAIEDTTEAIKNEVGSINDLREKNKQLTKERNATSDATEAGRKRLAELNAMLDQNNAKIKANVDNYTRQKIGIGDYAGGIKSAFGALQQTIPALGAFQKGQEGVNLALKANPIGAVIALFLTLKQLLGGNAEIADKLSFAFAGVTKGFNFLIDKVVNGVKAFTDFRGLMVNVASFLADPIGSIAKFGKELFNAAAEGYNAAEAMDNFTVKVAEQNAKIRDTEIQINALTKTLKDKTKSEQERIAIATKVADLEIENSERQRVLAQETLENERLLLKGRTLNADEQAKLIQLESDVRAAEAEKQIAINDRTTKINILLAKEEAGQLRDIRAEEKAKKDAERDEEKKKKEQEKADGIKEAQRAAEAFAKAEEQAADELDRLRAQEQIKATKNREERLRLEIEYQQLVTAQKLEGVKAGSVQEQLIKEEGEAAILAIEQKYADESTKLKEEQAKKDKAISDARTQNRINELSAASSIAGNLSTLAKKESTEQKALTLASIAFNLAAGIAAAVKAGAGLVFPANLGAIATGVSAVVAAISGARGALKGFADGGLTGKKISPKDGVLINRANGDNLLATVRTGEVILNERHQALLGGAKTFARIGVPGFASSGLTGGSAVRVDDNSSAYFEELINAVKTTKTVLVREEFEARQMEANSIVSKATVV